MKIFQKGTSYYSLVAHKDLAYGHVYVLEVHLIHYLPFLVSLAFVTQQSAYNIYKMDGFCIPTSWYFHPVPIDSKNFHSL